MSVLKTYYDRVVNEPAFGFIQMPDGQLLDCSERVVVPENIYFDVFPGSYNPLHDGHREIFAAIKNPNKAFEIAISRMGKPDLSFEELQARLKQFEWKDPVLVLRYPKFVEKAGVLSLYKVKFHVGFDTAKRIVEQHSIAEIQGMRCWFCVYPRLMGDKVCGLEDLGVYCPHNFLAGPALPESVHGISSTAIRNGTKG